MKRPSFLILSLVLFFSSFAQQDRNHYTDSMKAYQVNYINTHEVVKKKDRKYFRFFPIDRSYLVNAHFEKLGDTTGFTMTTSAHTVQHYFKYGRLDFSLSGTACHLYIYQSHELMKNPKLKDYLFVPFTDATTGDESYGSGRYLEFFIQEINNDMLVIDFNKAYNPYCAYATGYHCPIPPGENHLLVPVKAGEKNFGKTHH